MSSPIWAPSAERIAGANLSRFIQAVRTGSLGYAAAPAVTDFASLYAWSIDQPERFWPAVWRFCGVVAEGCVPPEAHDSEVVIGRDRMAPPDAELGPRWFPGARLNFTENLLRGDDRREAVVEWNEGGPGRRLSHAELRDEVARCRAALRASGIGVGDRVAGYLPNVAETVIAMLATASLGGIWSSCSPDFGVQGVVDRFGQIAPKVLVCADGYRHKGRVLDCRDRIAPIAAQIGEPEVVVVRASGLEGRSTDPWRSWDRWLADAPAEPLAFERLPFDHPLYVMFSSGTTGLPKCMVHGAGGTLLQHLKELVLHTDVRAEDRVFYFTTCGWMMWNWLVSALAVGATIVLYDGAPLAPNAAALWDMAAAERITVFGTSAKYLALVEKYGLAPARTHDLRALRTILSTGSPLAPASFEYVYRDVKADVALCSISGGTDIISCFALGNPLAPVHAGELQSRGLGMAVQVYDEDGRAVVDEPGELVCEQPFPSMPVCFWNDADGERYRQAYFNAYPGVWRHGDWATLTRRGGLVILGRSDATLNPGGVRIGTAEIYRIVETLPEILESLVVGQEVGSADDRDVRIVLFVRLAPNATLDKELERRIRGAIRAGASPHHVPRVMLAVADIPRTVSGKITELAVRETIHGRTVRNIEALANPESLAEFRDRPELRIRR